MAPEVWNNEDIDGPAFDVWCLGCILFAMLCGRLPFDNGSLSEFKIPDDATMIERTNNLDYKFNQSSLSEEAKDWRATTPLHHLRDIAIATLRHCDTTTLRHCDTALRRL